MTVPTLFDAPLWVPWGDRCRYWRCNAAAVAVTAFGMTLCADHHAVVAAEAPILRPRLMETTP